MLIGKMNNVSVCIYVRVVEELAKVYSVLLDAEWQKPEIENAEIEGLFGARVLGVFNTKWDTLVPDSNAHTCR